MESSSFGVRLGMVVVAVTINVYLWGVSPRKAVNQVVYPVAPPLVHIEGMGEQTLAQPGQVDVQPGSNPTGGGLLFALRPVVESQPDAGQKALLDKVVRLEKRQFRLAQKAHQGRIDIQQVAVELGAVLGEQRLRQVIDSKPDAVDQVGEATVWRELDHSLKDAIRQPW